MWRRIVMSSVSGWIALAAILLVGCSGGSHPDQVQRVAPGVTLDGFMLGEMELEGALDLIEQAAMATTVSPIDGRVSDEGHCVPGRWGLHLNVEELKRRISLAPQGAQLLSIYELLSPTGPAECQTLPVREAAEGAGNVGLMINVAWGEEHLPQVLSVLQQGEARATFFVMGFWATDHSEDIRHIAQMGHEIAVHGYRDVHPQDLSPGALREDLELSIATLTQLTGTRPVLYTPHYGEVSDVIIRTAADLGLTTLLWTTDTVDWKNPSPEQMLDRVVPDTKEGAFILMHPTENTVVFLSEYLARLKSMGLQARSCSEALSRVPAPTVSLNEVLGQWQRHPD